MYVRLGQREIQNSKKGLSSMKTITKYESKYRKRGLLLSLICAGVIAASLGGCAEGPYVTAYDTGYYPAGYYSPYYYDYYNYYGYPYSYYYGPTDSSRVYYRVR
jgi:hypothetical protein